MLTTFVRVGRHYGDIRVLSGCDEHFRTVYHITVPVPDRDGMLADRVGARPRFGQSKGPDHFPGGEGLEIGLLQIFGSVQEYGAAGDRIVDGHDHRGGSACIGDLLKGHRVADRVHPGTAVFNGHIHTHESQFAHRLESGARKLPGSVALGSGGLNHFPGEFPDHGPDHALLFVQIERH